MSRTIFDDINDEISSRNAEAEAKRHVMVNLRPGQKTAAMIELLLRMKKNLSRSSSEGRSGSASSLIAGDLPEKIATYVVSSPKAAEIIRRATETVLKESDGQLGEGSALSILAEVGLLKVETPADRRRAAQMAEIKLKLFGKLQEGAE